MSEFYDCGTAVNSSQAVLMIMMHSNICMQRHSHDSLGTAYTVILICSFCRSPEWKLISDAERKNLGLTFDDDGEFWLVVVFQTYTYFLGQF